MSRSSALSYDIYLHQEKVGEGTGQPNRLRLLYFKPACSQDEIGTRFFMHVIPGSADDLPKERKEAGYVELDFALEDFGGRYGGDCFAVRDLPEYDILEIRTGQTTGENSNSLARQLYTWQLRRELRGAV